MLDGGGYMVEKIFNAIVLIFMAIFGIIHELIKAL